MNPLFIADGHYVDIMQWEGSAKALGLRGVMGGQIKKRVQLNSWIVK